MSIQGHPTLPLSLQSQKAAAEENAESETSTLRMNNAAMNETAALCHESRYENYGHTNATLLAMCVQLIQTQQEGTSPDFTFSSEPSSTSL